MDQLTVTDMPWEIF